MMEFHKIFIKFSLPQSVSVASKGAFEAFRVIFVFVLEVRVNRSEA